MSLLLCSVALPSWSPKQCLVCPFGGPASFGSGGHRREGGGCAAETEWRLFLERGKFLHVDRT